MPFDVEKLITEQQLGAEDAAAVRALYGRKSTFFDGYMRQDEFSRKMDGAKTEKEAADTALADRRAELDAEYGAMATWKRDSEGQLTTAQAAVKAAEARAAAAEEAVKKAATEAGLDPQTFLKDLPSLAARVADDGKGKGNNGNGDGNRGTVDKDELAKLSLSNMAVSEALMHINTAHQQLFGKPLPSDANLTGKWAGYLKRGEAITLQEVFEREFKVPERRAELDAAGRKKDVDDAVAAALTKERSEAALRGTQGFSFEGPQSPVLKESFERTQKARPGVSGLERAAAMYTTEQNRIIQQQTGAAR